MHIMTHLYRIAGVTILINSKEIYLHRELDDFEIKSSENIAPDMVLTILEQDINIPAQGKNLVKSEQLSIDEYEEYFCINYLKQCSLSCYTVSKRDREAFIYISKKYRECEASYCNGNKSDMTELMYAIRDSVLFYLLQQGRVVIHSASFIYKGKVWLFSAPSGTGKSTHVSLWKKKGYPIEDFNGDLCACYIDEYGKAMATGLPWCGTSGIYKNKTLPLGGIFFLKRNETDKVVSLKGFDAVLHLLARLITPNWTKELVATNLEIAQNIAPEVHSALLYCTMNDEAAIKAKEYIDKI